MVHKLKDTGRARHIFGAWEETIIWSCLQGIMGHIYADDEQCPHSAAAMLGDFAFFAGRPARELILHKPEDCPKDFIIMVPENDAWGRMIEDCWKEKARKVSRYAMKKEPWIFDKEHIDREWLGRLRDALPGGYELKLIDEDIYRQCREREWSRDLVSQYKDYEIYERLGLGVAVVKDGKVVSGASSYSSYAGGIEIEIDTHEPFRRMGLAAACGAGLILECHRRGLYPSWDAQNKWSVALAEKLGYHYSHEYPAYEIWGY